MTDDKVAAAARKLAAAKDRARRKAMGPPLPSVSEDELTALAAVGPEDAGEIETFIRQSAGPLGVALFNATEADDDA